MDAGTVKAGGSEGGWEKMGQDGTRWDKMGVEVHGAGCSRSGGRWE